MHIAYKILSSYSANSAYGKSEVLVTNVAGHSLAQAGDVTDSPLFV
jgi:hypothetical protein